MTGSLRHLDTDDLIAEMDRRPGLMPVRLLARGRLVLWCDLEGQPLSARIFDDGVRAAIARTPSPAMFTSSIEAVAPLDVPRPPAGFILHMGRCGSSVISNALAQPPSHAVASEALVHNQLWWRLTGGWTHAPETTDAARRTYRNVILLTGRPRLPGARAYFVRFTSWNTLLIGWIRRTFPQVPFLFVYRDPVEVLVSLIRTPPNRPRAGDGRFTAFLTGHPPGDAVRLDDVSYHAARIGRLMEAAASGDVDGLTYLNYAHLSAATFGAVVERAFGRRMTPAELELARGPFAVHSKDERQAFVADSEDKQRTATPEVRGLAAPLAGVYERLARSNRNVVESR